MTAKAIEVQDSRRCDVCNGVLMDASREVFFTATGADILSRLICDACRRKYCTCGNCAAWDHVIDDDGWCRRMPPEHHPEDDPATRYELSVPPRMERNSWCLDGWVQARPILTEDEK